MCMVPLCTWSEICCGFPLCSNAMPTHQGSPCLPSEEAGHNRRPCTAAGNSWPTYGAMQVVLLLMLPLLYAAAAAASSQCTHNHITRACHLQLIVQLTGCQ